MTDNPKHDNQKVESGYVRCRLCGKGMAAEDAEAHIAAHGRVMTALATDQATECGDA